MNKVGVVPGNSHDELQVCPNHFRACLVVAKLDPSSKFNFLLRRYQRKRSDLSQINLKACLVFSRVSSERLYV